MIEYVKLEADEHDQIERMSAMATEIVREHFDPIIGTAQNDYMLNMFQTVSAITEQLQHGYQYYFVKEKDEYIGFLAFYPKEQILYLSKFYLYKKCRGRGVSVDMLEFVKEHGRKLGLAAIELNVNRGNYVTKVYERLGFTKIREEKNDIGAGFYMDDYVYHLDI